ncbi:MAG: hypothetical protein SFX72_03955 [Isosphaeraceae bacterium]|nr:hypothetical protein [Isosphaeraceae bacterium]
MTSFSLIDPILMAWPGYETLVRRVVLRRPEERMVEPLRYHPSGGGFDAPRYDFWSGPDLTWTRILARDLGAPTRRVDEEEDRSMGRISNRAEGTSAVAFNPIDFYQVPVAEWIENSAMPNLARAALQEASGIEIPNARFVLKVILAYVICLVPLNWLICRYGLGRREWAWVLAPLFAFGFAIVVERAAAYDVGFDSTCDEIDLLETHGDHPRGHISRFASLYTTGRAAYSISFPEDPTALVLPMSTGRSIRGEESQKARFQILPHPALTEYQLQPRSLSMYRAEQLATLDGVPAQSAGVGPSGRASIRNTGPVELRDAVLVELKRSGSICRELGSIAPGATVEAGEASIPIEEYVPGSSIPSLGDRATLRPADFLETLVRSSTAARPEDEGELRLIAWTDRILPGQVIEPPVDRHRGFTLVVAHLRGGDLPDPDSPDYDARGDRSERLPERIPTAPVLNVPTPFGFRGAGMPGLPPGIQIPRGAMPAAPGRGRSKGEAGENEADDLSPEDFSSEKPQR